MVADPDEHGPTATTSFRLVLLLAVMFWQGGFMFYGAVVVPVGSQVLGSELVQGFVTRSVTGYLNLAGLVALLIWGMDVGMTRARDRKKPIIWALLVITLGAQFVIRAVMNALLDPEAMRILDRPAFRDWHIAYLLVSTVQWAMAVGLLALTLASWGRVSTRARSHVDRMT